MLVFGWSIFIAPALIRFSSGSLIDVSVWWLELV